jgi:hypothetical protein
VCLEPAEEEDDAHIHNPKQLKITPSVLPACNKMPLSILASLLKASPGAALVTLMQWEDGYERAKATLCFKQD